MCGISFAFQNDLAEHITRSTSHRGVRHKIRRLAKNAFIGHNRLPIQGLDSSQDHPQQFGSLTGAFVGEIFNFREFSPDAKSDLPVLLEQFMKKGFHCFEEFDGFWAGIIHDSYTNTVVIFTDFLAKKPLYYRTKPFCVSSEIKGLIGHNLKPLCFDEVYFSAVRKWGYCPENRTPFEGIKKLAPGCFIKIDLRTEKWNVYRYDTLKPISRPLGKHLIKAVKNRLVSDVPISILLSGGLDSTIIYELLKTQMDNKITIFHIENDEAQYLEYIDIRPQDEVRQLKINSDDLKRLSEILYHNDGPVDLGSMVPQYLLAEAIRKEGFAVCISGDGADELFGGYKRAAVYDSQRSDIFHELVQYHLPRLDKMMMAHTVELRCPFLSRPVIEAAMATPYQFRINKLILKKVFGIILPKEIVERKKVPLRFKKSQEWTEHLIRLYRSFYNECERRQGYDGT